MGPGQRKSSQQAGGRVPLFSPLTEEETEAQRWEVTCPEAQGQEMAEGASWAVWGGGSVSPRLQGPRATPKMHVSPALVTAMDAVIVQPEPYREPQPAFAPPRRPPGSKGH